MRVRDLSDAWRTWLGDWLHEFDPDLSVWIYEDDGTDAPDEWADEPHLAIREDVPLRDGVRAMVWPVHVAGWADPAEIGWQGVADLAAQDRRT